jgi:hypothetical protein
MLCKATSARHSVSLYTANRVTIPRQQEEGPSLPVWTEAIQLDGDLAWNQPVHVSFREQNTLRP